MIQEGDILRLSKGDCMLFNLENLSVWVHKGRFFLFVVVFFGCYARECLESFS